MIEAILAGLFGLFIGSFLNVCIYRWPRDLSVVKPRSHCPHCDQTIAWFDNIPVVSFLRLRGRCRHCGQPISLRYTAVEILTGLLFFSFVKTLGPTLPAVKFCILTSIVVALVFSDLEERILPDEFTLGGLVIGLVFAWFVPITDGPVVMLLSISGTHWPVQKISLVEAFIGAFGPSSFLWVIGLLFEKVRHKEGLGFGDVKMMAMLGAFVGLRLTLSILILGSLLGSIVGLLFIWLARKEAGSYELPFGSFLGIAALLVCLWSQKAFPW